MPRELKGDFSTVTWRLEMLLKPHLRSPDT
jgi:hypothetical protein